MKSLKYFSYILAFILIGGCTQEVIDLKEPEPVPPDTSCEDAVTGSADFTKFIAIGNSFVAGVQGGALFTNGQNNSLPVIMNKQFECVGAAAAFNQPTIGASLGWNLFVTQPIVTPTFDPTKQVFGRMLLQYSGSTSPRPTPQKYAVGVWEAVPNTAVNPGFDYLGNTNELNNFGVAAITLGQALSPATGGPNSPANPAYSPFYMRFASSPSPDGASGSSILTDANSADGTFALVWLGMDDFFLYAAFGGDSSIAPITKPATFGTRFGALFGHPAIGLLTQNPEIEAVVGNFPDIFKMPHFTSVPWNAIVFAAADQTTKIDPTNNAYAPYNGGLDAAFGGGLITASERDKRKIHFAVGANGIVIEDETLTNLSALGLPSIRHATSADIFPLSTGSVLGTEATPGNPATTWGVGKALTDRYAIVPAEKDGINATRAAYNTIVQNTVNAFSTKLVLADIDGALNSLIANQAAVINGVTITPNINPPTGIYSEDGVHPNTRGYAFLSRVFIGAINAKFGSTVPLTDLSLYSATGLPIP